MVEKKFFDVLVIGGGPAGMAAAVQAGRAGACTGLVDDNPTLGGQIWRGETLKPRSDAANWVKALGGANVEVLTGTHVFHQSVSAKTVFAESREGSIELAYRKLILATGARERFLPFPGWTLPNVMAAGGLQAMAKSGLPVAGKRIVVAGTGPLLLAVASYLVKHGAKVPMLIEQASRGALVRFSLGLAREPGKLLQGMALGRSLATVPIWTNSWVMEAKGEQRLQSLVIAHKGKIKEVACDYLACGFHLVPNTELAQLMGCNLRNGYVEVNELQQTSIEDVYCAGEPTGIGGLDSALLEGEIAGLAAAGLVVLTAKRRKLREKRQDFANRLESTFQLRAELRTLAEPDTLVCRCEDVPFGSLRSHESWRSAKLHTRCGMGPCQGRVCGPATQFLFGWQPDSVRPPIYPVQLESLAAMQADTQTEVQEVSGGLL